MARYVNVGVIGPNPLTVDEKLPYKDVITEMKRHWEKQLNQVICDNPDIILIPEACDRPLGYPLNKRLDYYKERGEEMLNFFREKAKENRCYIAYSAARQLQDSSWRNSTQVLDRYGNIVGIYDKNYPTIGEIADWGILPGNGPTVIDTDFGRIGCAICFDINFDELKNQYKNCKPEMILFSSMMHGGLMANSWAFECRSYFVGAIGGPQSYIISPLGKTLATNTNYYDYISYRVNLDYCVCFLDYNWDALAAMRKKYGMKVRVEDPGFQGSVLVTSETDEFTVQDLVKEFGLELLDDYMQRSKDFRDRTINQHRL
jgi:predicted amidohydrolase